MAHILLAEDDPAMRGFLKAALEKDGHDVDDAEDGAIALDFINSDNRYDIILTDIVMPHMDGLELSRHVKNRFPAIPVLFITGFAGMAPDTLDDAKAPQIISKPFHLKDIVARVNEILANKPLPKTQ